MRVSFLHKLRLNFYKNDHLTRFIHNSDLKKPFDDNLYIYNKSIDLTDELRKMNFSVI